MTTYKATQGSIDYYSNFNDLAEATTYFTTKLGECTVILSATQIPDKSPQQKLQEDMMFGYNLVNEFLLDNRLSGPYTLEESIAMEQQFGPIQQLLLAGSILQAKEATELTPTGAVLTQARKDNYLTKMNNYLGI